MRPNTTLGMLAAAAILVACGDAGPDEDPGPQERIDALEDELEETRQDAEDLLEENERLVEEIRVLTSEEADEPEPDEPSDGPTDVDAPPADRAEPAPLRSPEGLIEQLRTLFGVDRGPDDAWNPGVTEWAAADAPDGLQEVYETPGALAFDLATALEAQALGMDTWETTTRVLLDDEDEDLAYVAVLSWGYADDALAGADWRMTITRSDDGWSPGGAEQRAHCRRGVTDDDLCV